MIWRQHKYEPGFTFVEIAIVAPIVILAIGAFITAVVSMTGEVLISRTSTQMVYNVQDALNRIDQDVKQSSTFLAETNIPLTSPQGYNDDTTVFDNVDSTKGTMLILNSLATTGNPLATTSSIAYLSNSPNACGTLQGQNTPLTFNIVYFVKNNTLWRRTIAPASYATAACNATGTGTAAPWQRPSCTAIGGFCKTQDERLVDGVSTSGFTVQYYNGSGTSNENTAASANPSCNTTLCVATRNSALASASTVNVTIDDHQTVASKDVEQVASVRSTRLDTTATAVASNIVPTTAPNTPSGLSTTRTIATQVTITWYATAYTTSYTLQYATNPSFTSPTTVSNITSSPQTITGLNGSSTYYFQIRSDNSYGSSSWSSAVSVSPAAAPNAPTSLAASAPSTSQVNLSWSANNATNYNVQWSTDSGFSSTSTMNVTSTSASVTGLSAGTTYYFRVSALNSFGSSGWSTSASTITLPTTPTGLTVYAEQNIQNSQASWNGVASATSYDLQTATDTGFTANVRSVNVSATSIAVFSSSLNPGSQNYFRVRANNGSGSGSWSSTTVPVQTLQAGQCIYAGTYGTGLRDNTGNYILVIQPDGNLVEYDASSTALWNTGTFPNSNSRLCMQTDGNVVVYNGSNGATWNNGKGGTGSTNYLIVQSDNNVVEYNSSNVAVWSRR